MASRGRGRGQPSRSSEPGKLNRKIPKSIEELNGYLRTLNEGNIEVHGREFADMVSRFADSEEKLINTVDLVFDTTVASRDYSNLGGAVCEYIIHKGSDATFGSKFMQKLLKRFQLEVKSMEQTRNKSVEDWLGIFAFLCEIFCRIKVNDKPIIVVGKAILQNIVIMLANSDVIDDEIDTICTKLKSCGRFLENQDSGLLEEIIITLRKQVISGKSSCQRRCVIMQLIELKNIGWFDQFGTLDKFYVDALADAVVEDET